MNITKKHISCQEQSIFLNIYLPEQTPKAIIQINHGLAEHSQRYREFATFLCEKGYGVYFHDHPAHGKSAADPDKLGHLPWRGGWDSMLAVIHTINKQIRKAHPQVPVFLFGHSMGSLLARYYNATFPMYFKGMILSGTTNPGPSKLKSSLTVVKFMKMYRKSSFKSPWLNNLFYKGYSKTLQNPATDFDWLTSNPHEVQKYIEDPCCGFQLSLGFFKNLLQGTLQMLKTEKQLRFRKNFSTLIIAGKMDPVGNFGKDPEMVFKKYRQQGFFRTQLHLVEQGRHELLNEHEETQKEFFRVVDNFIQEKLRGQF